MRRVAHDIVIRSAREFRVGASESELSAEVTLPELVEELYKRKNMSQLRTDVFKAQGLYDLLSPMLAESQKK